MKEDLTRRLALSALIVSITAIAVAYASAFRASGPPTWAAWLLALGIPLSLGAIMILGAARGGKGGGVGSLKLPFAFVIVVLAAGFCAALLLPATESATSGLWLGLPARAAIVIYGVGLLPAIVLPVAYALTFETQTLTAQDIERVRVFARAREIEQRELGERMPLDQSGRDDDTHAGDRQS